MQVLIVVSAILFGFVVWWLSSGECYDLAKKIKQTIEQLQSVCWIFLHHVFCMC